nr:hypothetical protein CFP56_62740 [Quercus suber]
MPHQSRKAWVPATRLWSQRRGLERTRVFPANDSDPRGPSCSCPTMLNNATYGVSILVDDFDPEERTCCTARRQR